MLLTTSKWKSGDEEKVDSDKAEKGRSYEEKKDPQQWGVRTEGGRQKNGTVNEK